MFRLMGLIVCCAVLSACSLTAPSYAPSVENIQSLRDSGASGARVGRFEAGPEANNTGISLRGAPMSSPVDGKFSSYIEEAMRSELKAARLLDEKSDIEITGGLIQNDVSVGSITEGSAILEGRIVVRRGGQVRYDQVKLVRFTFESSFAGAVAIPRGVQAYPDLVRRFLAELYADKAFIGALK